MITGAGDDSGPGCICRGVDMSLIEEGTHPWISGVMIVAGGVAALVVGDLPLKALGALSIVAGPLSLFLHWRISKDIIETEERAIEASEMLSSEPSRASRYPVWTEGKIE